MAEATRPRMITTVTTVMTTRAYLEPGSTPTPYR